MERRRRRMERIRRRVITELKRRGLIISGRSREQGEDKEIREAPRSSLIKWIIMDQMEIEMRRMDGEGQRAWRRTQYRWSHYRNISAECSVSLLNVAQSVWQNIRILHIDVLIPHHYTHTHTHNRNDEKLHIRNVTHAGSSRAWCANRKGCGGAGGCWIFRLIRAPSCGQDY